MTGIPIVFTAHPLEPAGCLSQNRLIVKPLGELQEFNIVRIMPLL
jgi:hypothetical protein